MGRLTSAVHWWEESQMRVLVLGSLVFQFLLFIFTFLRRRAIPGWIRFSMWLAYLGGDAIAIYALATLFNRHKDQDRGSKSTLEVVWAPILLLHLGGHDGITAYNIEDNELWSRHLLTAVSQVTVAIYVFWKSWPPDGDKKLLRASILLFVPGVLKCFTKPWALKRASITSLVSSTDAKRTAKKGEAGEMDPNSLEKYVKQAKAFVQGETDCVEKGDHPPPQRAKPNKDEMMMDPFEEYVKRAKDFVVGEQKDEGGAQGERAPVEDTKRTETPKETRQRLLHRQIPKERRERILRHEAYKLFVDLSSPYAGRRLRLSIFKYFWVLTQEKAETTTTRKSKEEQEEDKADTAYGYVRRGLASAFLLLYTNVKTSVNIHTVANRLGQGSPASAIGFFCRQWIWMSRVVLPWAAIGLFHKSRREAYNDTDVKITYAILCCTAVLEYYSIVPIFSGAAGKEWPEMVAQYSLIGYFARNQNHSKKMMILSKLRCKDLVDQRWCMKPCFSSRGITELVLQYLKAGWEKKIQDVASYRGFIDNRGNWALEGNEDLSWSIKEPFDESVLLWHIATDFCFFSSPFSEHRCAFAKTPSIWSDSETEEDDTPPAQETKCGKLTACRAVQCRQMSNYMVYLLFVNPEMLLPGTRRNLFLAAYDELKDILVGDKKLNPQSYCHCHCNCNCEKVEEKDLMKALTIKMQDKSKKQDRDNGSKEESKQEGQPNGENFIDDAWVLAQGLLKLRDDFGDEKLWDVIQGVWVEMLCFSASRCRGYLHAKALGSGGEFISYVWLLLFYMGMETFTERLQREREELPSQEANNNGAPPPSDAHRTSSSTSWTPSRGVSSSTSHPHPGASTSSPEFHVVDMD